MPLNPLFHKKSKASTPPSEINTHRHHPAAFLFIAHGHALKASIKKVWQKPISFVVTVLVIAITIALPAILYILLNNFQQIAGKWHNKPNISLYLKNNIRHDEVLELITYLKQQPNVTHINYISPEQGLLDLKKFSEFSDVLPLLKTNPLPPVISITFSHFNPKEKTSRALLKTLKQSPLIDQTNFDTEWIQKMQYILSLAQRIILTLALLLGVGVVLIVSNTIRLITQSQQQEISVLKFIGATYNYIRRPFLYQGLCYGLFGGLLAWSVVSFVTAFIASPTLKLIESYHSTIILHGSSFFTGMAILAVSAALSLTGSWLAIQQHLYEQVQ